MSMRLSALLKLPLSRAQEVRTTRRNAVLPHYFQGDRFNYLGPEMWPMVRKSSPTRYREAKFVRHWRTKLLLSTAAALWLIVPMIIMSIHADIAKSLSVCSVAILSFGCFAVGGTFSDGKLELVSVKAAYAVVITVFVGTSLGTTPGVQ